MTQPNDHAPLSAHAAPQPCPLPDRPERPCVLPPDIPVTPGPVDAPHCLPMGVHRGPTARIRHPHPGSTGRYWVDRGGIYTGQEKGKQDSLVLC